MSAINGIGPQNPVQRVVTQPVQKQLPTEPAKQTKMTDRVEFSKVSHLLQTLRANDIRAQKVSEIRAQLEAGTYETEAKLDGAISRLLNDLS